MLNVKWGVDAEKRIDEGKGIEVSRTIANEDCYELRL